MNTLFVEPFCGVAGDMLTASLLGLGVDYKAFKEMLSSLPVDEEWDIELEEVSRHAITANLFKVKLDLLHHHHNHHHHRSLSDIHKIIMGGEKLPDVVKDRACAVFSKLAEAEAEVHGKDIKVVHFHEVGAVDAIIDITGVCLALYMLDIERIISTPISLGSGTVHSAHGVLPVPVPATVNLVRDIPTEHTGIKSELATPTGAALLATLVNEWNVSPSGNLKICSYGAGTRDLKERAAVIRVSLYRECASEEVLFSEDEVGVLECNIDDMQGEVFSWLSDKLINKGVLDFSLIPVTMKKGRPGIILQVICSVDKIVKFADLLLKESTTLGVRYRIEKRFKLDREVRSIDTPWGKISAKFAKDRDGSLIKVKPEFESVVKLAEESNLSYLEMYEKIRKELS
jgi:uncharacterized protein (TIGR00299 family) protein